MITMKGIFSGSPPWGPKWNIFEQFAEHVDIYEGTYGGNGDSKPLADTQYVCYTLIQSDTTLYAA